MAAVGKNVLEVWCKIWIKSNHFFFFNDTATTEIYTLSLHDALPISITPAIAPDAPTVGTVEYGSAMT